MVLCTGINESVYLAIISFIIQSCWLTINTYSFINWACTHTHSLFISALLPTSYKKRGTHSHDELKLLFIAFHFETNCINFEWMTLKTNCSIHFSSSIAHTWGWCSHVSLCCNDDVMSKVRERKKSIFWRAFLSFACFLIFLHNFFWEGGEVEWQQQPLRKITHKRFKTVLN